MPRRRLLVAALLLALTLTLVGFMCTSATASAQTTTTDTTTTTSTTLSTCSSEQGSTCDTLQAIHEDWMGGLTVVTFALGVPIGMSFFKRSG